MRRSRANISPHDGSRATSSLPPLPFDGAAVTDEGAGVGVRVVGWDACSLDRAEGRKVPYLLLSAETGARPVDGAAPSSAGRSRLVSLRLGSSPFCTETYATRGKSSAKKSGARTSTRKVGKTKWRSDSMERGPGERSQYRHRHGGANIERFVGQT